MPRTLPSQVLRFVASVAVIVLLAAHSPAAAPQKPATPSSNPLAKLEDRVKDLEARLAAAEQKADKATMEKEYILRTQNHYEAYYKEVFSMQTHILWTIGITATLISITLTAVFFVAGRFGFNIFDRRIEAALGDATAQLRTDFAERLANETNALQEAHAAELKTLEDGLSKRINEQGKDLKFKSDYQFQFAQGLGFHANSRWDSAILHFRMALHVYKEGKSRGVFGGTNGKRPAANLFLDIKNRDKGKFLEAAKKELENDLYNGLEDELNFAVTEVPELAQLLTERESAQSMKVGAEPKTPVAAPAQPTPLTPQKDQK